MPPSARRRGSCWASCPAEQPALAAQGPAFRLALGLEYDGSAYHGWQLQSHAPSVQGALNRALSAVADAPVSTLAAGRTDAGVHALGQVVHFDTPVQRPQHAWLLGTNSHLPDDIAVLWVREVPPGFHARHSAQSRSYRYLVLNRPVRPALEHRRAWWVRLPLDAGAMQEGARYLLGEHDFSAFRAAGCQASGPVRRLLSLEVRRQGELVAIECRANGFLYHMVRNIAGALVRVGLGEAPPAWVGELLAGRDRKLAAPTAPAQGLYLAGVEYPAALGLPDGALPMPREV